MGRALMSCRADQGYYHMEKISYTTRATTKQGMLTVGGAVPGFENPADELLGRIASCGPSLGAASPSIIVERWLFCSIPFGPPTMFLSG